jgi:hypothetical protein
MAFDELNPTSDESKAALARAFDSAWERFIAAEGAEAETDDNQRKLAGRIVALAKSGQSDEDALSEAGLIYLLVRAEAERIGARNRSVASPELAPSWGDEGGHAFGPETVAAMSAALTQCLDALPLRIPSDAVKILSSSILDAASRGERDPGQLQRHALETLRSRQ